MLSFHIKFVQTDRETDNGKTICPDLSIRVNKNRDPQKTVIWAQNSAYQGFLEAYNEPENRVNSSV